MKTRSVCIAVCLTAVAFLLGRVTAQSDPADALKQADRAFELATSKGGAKAWASFFAEDGKMFRANATITQGRPAIEALMQPFLSQPGTTLRWQPTFAAIARSGELGYTTGESTTNARDDQGRAVQSHGRYVTIWNKQRDCSWKVALDIGTSTPLQPVMPAPKKN